MNNYYEVTYSIDGVIKRMNIPARDQLEVTTMLTNMFSGQKIEIISVLLSY